MWWIKGWKLCCTLLDVLSLLNRYNMVWILEFVWFIFYLHIELAHSCIFHLVEYVIRLELEARWLDQRRHSLIFFIEHVFVLIYLNLNWSLTSDVSSLYSFTSSWKNELRHQNLRLRLWHFDCLKFVLLSVCPVSSWRPCNQFYRISLSLFRLWKFMVW